MFIQPNMQECTTHTHTDNNRSAGSVGIYLQMHLTAACSSHFLPFEKGLHFPSAPSPPPIPPRMFIAQKIISLVISAPLWVAINFSSLHDGPACGHRSLTFSKKIYQFIRPSCNLSINVFIFHGLSPPSLRLLTVGWRSGFELMYSSGPR